jgi:hypothetical protein
MALEVSDIALEWIGLHLVHGRSDANLVAGGNVPKRFSSGTGEDDEPGLLLFGVHRG